MEDTENRLKEEVGFDQEPMSGGQRCFLSISYICLLYSCFAAMPVHGTGHRYESLSRLSHITVLGSCSIDRDRVTVLAQGGCWVDHKCHKVRGDPLNLSKGFVSSLSTTIYIASYLLKYYSILTA